LRCPWSASSLVIRIDFEFLGRYRRLSLWRPERLRIRPNWVFTDADSYKREHQEAIAHSNSRRLNRVVSQNPGARCHRTFRGQISRFFYTSPLPRDHLALCGWSPRIRPRHRVHRRARTRHRFEQLSGLFSYPFLQNTVSDSLKLGLIPR